ncbi:hypothetical protein D7Z54_06510 [Salibacterium salarium]|uniref:Lipoprotein n=1 Tax=Salibacterium salarium TaxID=284579 RepID=A0A428N752_9BACI|nr:hypothetical protein [Salibacterium salarium]RSL34210.1 hypothetical protein D7Z54_06510 [Salibacterium salarium]
MKIYKSVFALSFIFLAACGGQTGMQELEYQEFSDQINSEDFTGFAYMLWDSSDKDEGHQYIIEEAFEGEEEAFVYTDVAGELEDSIHEKLNEDTKDKDIYLPNDTVAYIKDGKVISEIDVASDAKSSEYNKALRDFIQGFK